MNIIQIRADEEIAVCTSELGPQLFSRAFHWHCFMKLIKERFAIKTRVDCRVI